MLVIVGPKGCGKTTLAQTIAEEYGSWAVQEELSLVGIPDVRTLIVDKFPRKRLLRVFLREKFIHRCKNGLVQQIPTPKLIVCCLPDDKRYLRYEATPDRPENIIDMKREVEL